MVDTAAIKNALTRKVGPLPVVAWVGIGGAAFLAYRALTGGSGASAGRGSSSGVVDGFDGSGGVTGTGGGGTGTGTGTGGGTGTIPSPAPQPVPTTKPSVWGNDIPATIAGVFSESAIKALFKKYGVSYGTVINQVDLQALFKKMGLTYGTRVDAYDLVKAGVTKVTTATTAVITPITSATTATVTPIAPVPAFAPVLRPSVPFLQNTTTSTPPTVNDVTHVGAISVRAR